MSKKLIYIVGYPRSGSTILQSILNEMPNAVAVGEIKTIINYNVLKNKPCSCGEEVSNCSYWHPIIEQLKSHYSLEELKHLNGVRKRISNRYFGKVRWGNSGIVIEENNEFGDFLKKLYGLVFETCDVVIDSSKDPMYGWFLSQILDVEIYYLHLIRDPRACYYSHKRDAVPAGLLRWSWMNFNSAFLARKLPYLRMRYEDFVNSPDLMMQDIFDFAGMPEVSNPISNSKIELNGSHALAGNPNRFNSGEVKIKGSSSWEIHLSKTEKIKVKLFAQPFFKQYGYR